MSENKVYGLILPKKSQAKDNKPKASSFNVFGNESDEEETPKGPVGPYGQVAKSSTKMKRQTQMDIEKALQEDPSVYEYDNIYDDMQAAKPKVGGGEKKKVEKDRKPKYIADLLKASEVKKKEDERRKERQVQKEREAEGEKFADKESFVTSAYKKKMLEMQEEEENEKRKAELEALTDVTKQKDMSGFYRYLYRQTTGPEVKTEVKPEVKQESDSDDGEEANHRNTESSSKPSTVSAQVKEEPASPSTKNSRSLSPSSPSAKKSTSLSSSGSDSESEESRPLKTTDKPTFNSRSKNLASGNFRKRTVDSSDSDSSPKHKDKTRKHRDRSRSPQDSSRSRNNKNRSRPHRSRSRSPTAKKSRSSSHKVRESTGRRRSRSGSPKHNKSSASRRRRSRSASPVREITDRRKRSVSPEQNSNETRELKSRNSVLTDSRPRTNDATRSSHASGDDIEESIKEMRHKSTNPDTSHKENLPAEKCVKDKSQVEVPPSQKVYPHHNSAKDIQEARKRYLQRKLERERSYVA